MIDAASCPTCAARCARDRSAARRGPGAALPARAQLRRRPAGVRRSGRRPRLPTAATPPRWSAARAAFLGRRATSTPIADGAGRGRAPATGRAGRRRRRRHRPLPGRACWTPAPGAPGSASTCRKPALRRAARAHPRVGAVLADTWRPAAAGRRRRRRAPERLRAAQRRPSSAGCCAPDGTLAGRHARPPTTCASWSTALGLLRVDPAKDERVRRRLDAHFARGRPAARRRAGSTSTGTARPRPSRWARAPGTSTRRRTTADRLAVTLPGVTDR